MISTLRVIPIETDEITFEDVIKQSEEYINASLDVIGLKREIKLQVHIVDYEETLEKDCNIKVDLSTQFKWKEEQTVIFSIEDIPGEITANCHSIYDQTDPKDPWWQLYANIDNTEHVFINLEEKLEKAKSFNRVWNIHRRDKNKIMDNISPFIAISIAELTSGLIEDTLQEWVFKGFLDKDILLKHYTEPKKVQTKKGFFSKLQNLFK